MNKTEQVQHSEKHNSTEENGGNKKVFSVCVDISGPP